MQEILAKLKVHQKLDLPFVLYKKPNEEKVSGVFQENDHMYLVKDFTEEGFVMAPFDNMNAIVIFPKSESKRIESENLPNHNYDTSLKEEERSMLSSKVDFELLVEKSIRAIKEASLRKVVVSRKEKLKLASFDVADCFQKLINIYPTAFTYCWYHPKVGLWVGATPEKLVSTLGKRFYSMSLAGTRENIESNEDWAAKEKEEQKIVTDYILENLKKITSEVSISSPYTITAGCLLHIKTDIKGLLRERSNLKQVITILHPTPAVCGLPKNLAKEFIKDNEVYHREYYTGFLGELNKGEELSSDLYVNLRCMKIKDNVANLYMGCGITRNSVPEKEWEETVNKSQTMKMILTAKKKKRYES